MRQQEVVEAFGNALIPQCEMQSFSFFHIAHADFPECEEGLDIGLGSGSRQ